MGQFVGCPFLASETRRRACSGKFIFPTKLENSQGVPMPSGGNWGSSPYAGRAKSGLSSQQRE